MPASYTRGQCFYPRGHPTCWAPSQRSRLQQAVPCGARKSAQLNAHLSSEWECTASQTETTICTRRKITHQFTLWQQYKYGTLGWSPKECGVVGEHFETPHFHPQHRHRFSWNGPAKNSVGPAYPSPHRYQTFPLLHTQMGYGPFCGSWAWRRRTNRLACCLPMSNQSTSLWSRVAVGAGVVRSRRFLGGVGFLTILEVGVGFLSYSDSRCSIGSYFTSHS